MTVKEFYDYITSKMTPEEALMKLLEGAVIQYDKLKFDEKGEKVHPLIIMANAALDMGWGFAVDAKSKDIQGLCTGTPEYINKTMNQSKQNVIHR